MKHKHAVFGCVNFVSGLNDETCHAGSDTINKELDAAAVLGGLLQKVKNCPTFKYTTTRRVDPDMKLFAL